MEKKVIIALDGIAREKAVEVAQELRGEVWGFKVNDLIIRYGVSIISELKAYGKVFADPKLYDIPNTIQNGCRAMSEAGADLITVHASAGLRGLIGARKGAGSAGILAVTALTSFGSDEYKAIYNQEIAEGVMTLAGVAAEAQVYGVVCSPEEISRLRAIREYDSMKLVVPGVRPAWYGKSDDQRRVASPQDAMRAGADLLVIGRPVLESSSPLEAVAKINSEIGCV